MYRTRGSHRNPAVRKKTMGGGERVWVNLIEGERGKELEMENDRGEKAEITEQQPTQQGSEDRTRVHARTCAFEFKPTLVHVCHWSCRQTALHKRKPFPSLLRSQRGAHMHACACSRAAERPYVSCSRENGARKEEGDGEAWGVGQAGGGSHYPPCQLWMELAEDYGTFCKATMGALRIHTHFHPLCFFPSIKQMQLCPCCLSGHLPGRHLEPPTPHCKRSTGSSCRWDN